MANIGNGLTVAESPSTGSASLQPQILNSAIEIISHLNALMLNRAALELKFDERQQVHQSYIVAVDRDNNRIALDELIPNNGQQHLLNGEALNIVTHRDGVRISWTHNQIALADTLDGTPCYWLTLPEKIEYHQRRDAFRADTLPEQSLDVYIDSNKLSHPISGRLVDISATGCRVKIKSALEHLGPLQPGQLYETFEIRLPGGNITLSAELRHLQKDESTISTFAGFKFHDINGQCQRIIERFVYQLQREARRGDDAFF